MNNLLNKSSSVFACTVKLDFKLVKNVLKPLSVEIPFILNESFIVFWKVLFIVSPIFAKDLLKIPILDKNPLSLLNVLNIELKRTNCLKICLHYDIILQKGETSND